MTKAGNKKESHFARQRRGHRNQHRNDSEGSYQKFENNLKVGNRYKLHQKTIIKCWITVYCRNPIQKIISFHFSPIVKLLDIVFFHDPTQDRHSTTIYEETTVSVFLAHSSIQLQCTRYCVTCRKKGLNKAQPLCLAV